MHFRIHVPEIIDHRIHTRTVFVHVDKPTPKKARVKETGDPKTYHKETHRENWSSWGSYHDHHDDDHHHHHHHGDLFGKSEAAKTDDAARGGGSREKTRPYQVDSYLPVPERDVDTHDRPKSPHDDTMARPPQYAVREEVNENEEEEKEGEPYAFAYEEGYHRGGESASGRVRSNNAIDFYDDRHEEGDRSAEEYSREKTHADRYLVDEAESRRISHASPSRRIWHASPSRGRVIRYVRRGNLFVPSYI